MLLACTLALPQDPDPAVQRILQSVESARIEATVKHLADYPTRRSGMPDGDAAADWLRDQYRALGYDQVRFEAFALRDGLESRNLIVTKPGTDPAAPIILIGAHYDSLNVADRDAKARAPGADDNASGSAALLELARILAPLTFRHTIVLAAFSGEEQGLVGSAALAKKLAADRTPIAAVINLDMVGHPIDPERHVIVVEDDRGNAHGDNDAASRAVVEVLTRSTRLYTRLEPKPGPMYGSDYMPFESAGYACAGLFDGADEEPFYHHATDLPDQVDAGYTAEVVRLLLAALHDLANRP
jgi:Zn-dependent M28 family amino/carboxypeptidase